MRKYQSPILPDEKTNIKIPSIPQYDIEEYDLTDFKKAIKFIDKIEKFVRTSYSYKKFISFLREYSDFNKCSFFKNVNNIDTYSIKIHIHHEPLTLFDIVSIIFNKRSSLNESIDIDSICKEVMYNHYTMKVGLIPLGETVHEAVHSGRVFIPTNIVFGYYQTFVRDYDKFISKDIKDILMYNETMSKEYDYSKENKILQYDPIYIDTGEVYELPSTETLIKMFDKQLQEKDKALEEQQKL